MVPLWPTRTKYFPNTFPTVVWTTLLTDELFHNVVNLYLSVFIRFDGFHCVWQSSIVTESSRSSPRTFPPRNSTLRGGDDRIGWRRGTWLPVYGSLTFHNGPDRSVGRVENITAKTVGVSARVDVYTRIIDVTRESPQGRPPYPAVVFPRRRCRTSEMTHWSSLETRSAVFAGSD